MQSGTLGSQRMLPSGTADPQLRDATIGVVTALDKEYAAVCAALDARYPVAAGSRSGVRAYSLAHVPSVFGGYHTVSVVLLPEMGNNAAAVVTADLLNDCPAIRHIIMCGIAGAVPSPGEAEHHVRLGDLVISNRGGVIQYDFIKETATTPESSKIESRFPARPPSAALLEAVNRLRAGELRGERPWNTWIERLINKFGRSWSRPAEKYDRLRDWDDLPTSVRHPKDPDRVNGSPRIFHGPIASANRLLKDPKQRDQLRERFGVKAVEMEGSGVADAAWRDGMAGYLVVRGTCDYCNKDKGNRWQQYAALIAAAYTRVLIEQIPIVPGEPSKEGPGPVGEPPHAVYNVGGSGNTIQIFHGDNVTSLPSALSEESVQQIAAAVLVPLTPRVEPLLGPLGATSARVESLSPAEEDLRKVVAQNTRSRLDSLQERMDALEFPAADKDAEDLRDWVKQQEVHLSGDLVAECYTLLAEVALDQARRSTGRNRTFDPHEVRFCLTKARDALG